MLKTKLKHLETAGELQALIASEPNVMVCCGRMGPMCIPVYAAMDQLQASYPQVAFRDMEFDNPEAGIIKNLPQCDGFMGLPYTVYYKNAQVVKATTSIQSKEQIKAILDQHLL